MLGSGATVLVKPERHVPLVSVRAVYPGGLRYETEATNGVNQLLSRLMTRATERKSAAQLARAIDDLSGSLHGSAGRNSLGLRGEFLSKHFERGLRLFAECLAAPSFAAEELERERSLLLQDIHARDDNPAGAAFDLFARTIFTRHPYRFDTLGEVASVKGLGEAELRALQRTAMHPSNLTLCIVGDVDVERAFALCEELFGGESAPRPAPPEVPAEPPQRAPRKAFRALDKEQAHLVLGYPGVTVRSPERHALEVLSSVLSGQGGRLFAELRDKRSMAYSVSSFSVEGLDPGYFGVYMGTSPEKVAAALEGIRAELGKVLEGPLGAEELARARQYLIGAHAIGLQKNSARAAIIAYDSSYDIGADNYTRYEQQIAAITAEDVLAVARQLLDPGRATLAILGPPQADVAFG
jgi:zinc protease